MSNSAVKLLRSQFEQTKTILQGTLDGVTSDVAHKDPGGKTGTIAANLAHIISGMDAFMLSQLTGNPPMLATSHADSHGMSELPPQGADSAAWYKNVQVDLKVMHEYGLAVFKAVDDHLAAMSDSDLEEIVDMGSFGEQTRSWLCTLILLNNSWHTGEIAAIKGMQGMQGYPF